MLRNFVTLQRSQGIPAKTGQKLFKTAHNLLSATRKAYSHAFGRPWATNDGTHVGRKTYVFVHKTPQKRLFAGSSGRKRPLRVTKLHPSLPCPSGFPFGRSGRPDLPQGIPRALAGGREIAIRAGFPPGCFPQPPDKDSRAHLSFFSAFCYLQNLLLEPAHFVAYKTDAFRRCVL